MADKKFLDEDGVSQFAEETKKYVDKHADNADIHVTTDDKTNWDGKQDALTSQQLAAVNSGINATAKGNYDAHVANADIHVTSADKNNWNSKQNALTSQQLANIADVVNKANASDLTAHTNNSDIHVTTSDKSNWNAKQDALTSQQLSNIADVVNKANDSDVVHKTGDETAAGVKTFSDGVVGNVTGNADTATKLKTARTINGTSFNGTANITTANWGTARNISITDGTNTSTAVSVNGSQAYSLNLPSTIKATFVGNITGNVTGNADTSTKATNNASGNELSNDIIKGLSVNGRVITYTKLDGSTGTITTQDTNTTYSNFVKSGSGAKAGLVPAPSTTAGTTKYLREDGTWQVPPDHTYTVNNATLTIQKNGTTVKTFTANASSNVTANIVVPTKTSELTNDSGFLTTHNPVDNALSSTSTNAVQNKVINTALNSKANVSDLANYLPKTATLESLSTNSIPFHNSYPRCKYLGTSITDAQNTAIKNRTYDDLFIGDYWTINGVNWRIVAIDYYYNVGDTNFDKGNIIVMPDTVLYNAQMNETNITAGAYASSLMRTQNLNSARTIARNAFGSHLANHRILLANAANDSGPSGWAWYDSDGVELPNEVQIYGTRVWGSALKGYDVATQKHQFPLMALAPQFVNTRQSYWLQDVSSYSVSGIFAVVYYYGDAHDYFASDSGGVRPSVTLSYI